eukprot:g9644.t1 g9644   contig4:205007-205948(-)
MKASLCLFTRSPQPQPSPQPIAPLPPFQIMIDTLQSPLTNVSVNGKRRFACSPIQDASTTSSSIHLTTNNSLATAISDDHHDANMMMMDDSHSYGFQSAKRRRKLSNDGLFGGGGMVGDSVMMKENNGWGVSPFVHSGGANGFAKRTRSPSPSPSHHKLQELRHTIEQQSSELTRLKSEKAASDQTSSQLSALHSKTENENRILKRAVAIQQERQNQLLGEVEEGRRFRVEAEERIRRLEQMNLSLQYQLQQSGIGGSGGGNDFIRFRHPDVY